ncbi:UPF0280 family protein [Palleronia aestuarii]|nr:UPF0280 family protein [Palleronia aestuarii]
MASADGRRLRLVHGPIDLHVTLEGPEEALRGAGARARSVFVDILPRLAEELPRLRHPGGPRPEGPVARRMVRAVRPFAPLFVTPMAAVAGSVADHVLAAMLVPGHGLRRAIVNNGGDIAIWLASGTLRVGLCDDPVARTLPGRIAIGAGDGIGGIATSGWRGRSHSLGIADAVTVLARDAAAADAAATLIANAVDLPGHPTIERRPAVALAPDSDLGERPVTTGVGTLSAAEIGAALDAGAACAAVFRARGWIAAACLSLCGEIRILGTKLELPAHA